MNKQDNNNNSQSAWDLVRTYRQAAQRAQKIYKKGKPFDANSIKAFELYVSFSRKMINVKL